MFFKLSLRNVKRSYQDYAIYFITLILAVSVFYVFNSLSSQEYLIMVLEGAPGDSVEAVEDIIIYLSMFIAVILGFLIIYANNFLFRRRKKELGIYLTLGMERRNIAGILLFETLIIGVISLGIGIGVGMLLSQVFGVIVVRMMDVYIEQLSFVFSWEVVGRTVLYFGIMFLAVIILNVLSVSRYKIINLIHAEKKHQKLGFSSGWISLLIFVLAITALGWAYKIVLSQGAFEYIFAEGNILPVIALGIIGTFLFFLSLSGFLMFIIKVWRRFYYNNLNIFTMRQISSRIQTNWISVAIISLMIFVSVCSVGVGMGLKEYYRNQDDIMTPFDVTIGIFSDHSTEEVLDAYELDLSQFTDEVYPLTGYVTGLFLSDLFKGAGEFKLEAYHLSEVNQILVAQGIEPIELKDNEMLVISNSNAYTEENFLSDTVVFNETEYTISQLLNAELFTSTISEATSIVFPDYVQLDVGEGTFRQLSFNYRGDLLSQEKEFMNHFKEIIENPTVDLDDFFISIQTKNSLITDMNILSILITFISFYIAVIFILVSMTVLALQQLIDAVESTERYNTLSKIGVDEKMKNRSLLAQVGTYFLLPLLLAGIHSAVGLRFFNRILVEETTSGRSNPTLVIASFAIVFGMYLLYFVATYWQYKRVLRGSR